MTEELRQEVQVKVRACPPSQQHLCPVHPPACPMERERWLDPDQVRECRGCIGRKP